jgi:hypothetical protein
MFDFNSVLVQILLYYKWYLNSLRSVNNNENLMNFERFMRIAYHVLDLSSQYLIKWIWSMKMMSIENFSQIYLSEKWELKPLLSSHVLL